VVRDLGLTSQQVWGLTKTDQEWSTALEAALTAARRDDLEHGTDAAYPSREIAPAQSPQADGGSDQLTDWRNSTASPAIRAAS
jgi:hypothetical protein